MEQNAGPNCQSFLQESAHQKDIQKPVSQRDHKEKTQQFLTVSIHATKGSIQPIIHASSLLKRRALRKWKSAMKQLHSKMKHPVQHSVGLYVYSQLKNGWLKISTS
eukprot:c13206_g1_i2 orf=373-690(+)